MTSRTIVIAGDRCSEIAKEFTVRGWNATAWDSANGFSLKHVDEVAISAGADVLVCCGPIRAFKAISDTCRRVAPNVVVIHATDENPEQLPVKRSFIVAPCPPSMLASFVTSCGTEDDYSALFGMRVEVQIESGC